MEKNVFTGLSVVSVNSGIDWEEDLAQGRNAQLIDAWMTRDDLVTKSDKDAEYKRMREYYMVDEYDSLTNPRRSHKYRYFDVWAGIIDSCGRVVCDAVDDQDVREALKMRPGAVVKWTAGLLAIGSETAEIIDSIEGDTRRSAAYSLLKKYPDAIDIYLEENEDDYIVCEARNGRISIRPKE